MYREVQLLQRMQDPRTMGTYGPHIAGGGVHSWRPTLTAVWRKQELPVFVNIAMTVHKINGGAAASAHSQARSAPMVVLWAQPKQA